MAKAAGSLIKESEKKWQHISAADAVSCVCGTARTVTEKKQKWSDLKVDQILLLLYQHVVNVLLLNLRMFDIDVQHKESHLLKVEAKRSMCQCHLAQLRTRVTTVFICLWQLV